MSKTVGYFEGTDPLLLNKLVARGIGTMPLSNGFDSHGKPVGYLTKQDGINLVVGYFYKVVPPAEMSITLKDILFGCVSYKIPVLLIAAKEIHEAADKITGGIPKGVKFVPPEKILDAVLKKLNVS
jgi:hypothetical protein